MIFPKTVFSDTSVKTASDLSLMSGRGDQEGIFEADLNKSRARYFQ
jgi:hypothetical protein